MELRRGTIRRFDSTSFTADVQLDGSVPTWLTGARISPSHRHRGDAGRAVMHRRLCGGPVRPDRGGGHSDLHVGQRAYEMSRQGRTMALPPTAMWGEPCIINAASSSDAALMIR